MLLWRSAIGVEAARCTVKTAESRGRERRAVQRDHVQRHSARCAASNTARACLWPKPIYDDQCSVWTFDITYSAYM